MTDAAEKSPVVSSSKPNLVIIFADDVGYGDLSCYGAKYKTPALDQMAMEGFRSTDMNVPSNVCTPSRASILTGRYPMRNGLPTYRMRGMKGNYGLHPDEITIAELLKTAGYRSLAVGKWHVGFLKEGAHPMDAGFDTYFGLPYNYSTRHDPWNMAIFRDREMIEKDLKFPGITDRYNEEVVQFIEKQPKDQPFFLYMAHQIAHTPIAPSKPFIGSSMESKYADFMTELDHSVGQVLQALRDNGLDDNTLVVFLSDNGPNKAGSAGPFAGGKYNTMEGGHRVPGIFRWTGKIPAGQVSDTTISSMDLLPLFCELAGVALPTDRTLDGKNILDVLLGQTQESPHQWLYYYNGHNLQAVRKGNWKLHLPRTAKDQPFWGQVSKRRNFVNLDQPFLVNLETDIGELHNVAADNPEVVDTFLKEADRIRAELGDVGQTGSDQRALWPTANSKLDEPITKSRPAPRSPKKKSRSNAAPKTDATPSGRSASFDFESGKPEPWKVVEGSFGHLIGNREEFFADKGEFNKQGNYYLTTLETSADGAPTDKQMGVIVSPLFIPKVGNMTFRVGGGGGESTYVALCTADGKEVEQARGINSHVMQSASWDLTPYIGKKMFIKVVDQSTGGWGHLTVDHFDFDAELLSQYSE